MHRTIRKTSRLRLELPRKKRAHLPESKRVAFARAHRIAECLQSLLQTCPSKTLCGLFVESVYEAAMEEAVVGGDSCDAFALPCGCVALVVADASGKGLEAAERVAEVRFALRAFLCEHGNPAQALACLNDFVCDMARIGIGKVDTFVTLTLLVLNNTSGRALCLCAGGEPPLVLRPSGVIDEVDICGPALGLFKNTEYTAAIVRIDPGDAVLLATDGITEARDRGAGGESCTASFLGLSGLADLARDAHIRLSDFEMPASPLSESFKAGHLSRSIFDSARAFAGGAFHDDACLLIARRPALNTN